MINEEVLYKIAEALKILEKETRPRCFHCGTDYIRDIKHSGDIHTTWMPNCECINKTTIRVVTGG